MHFLLFFIPALLILFAAHYFVYFSAVKFFSVTNVSIKLSFLAILFFLAVSFFVSSSLAHYFDNFFTRGYYFLSGVWLGVLTNLFFGFLAVWILFAISKLAKFNFNLKIAAVAFIFLAVIYSIYGVWNALHPQIKNIEVTIPNLPDYWKGKTIVQISDVHLGHIYKKASLEKTVRKINSVHPDMVLITGDLFDGMDGNLGAVISPIDDIKAPHGTYFITGNHETYLGVSTAFSILERTKVKILNDEMINIQGLQLIGIAYPERGHEKDVQKSIESLSEFNKENPSILMYHSPGAVSLAKNAGVNLQLSGHTHRGQIWPFGLITSLIYHGYDHGLHTDGNFSIYTSIGTGTWGPTMRTGNTPEVVVIKLK